MPTARALAVLAPAAAFIASAYLLYAAPISRDTVRIMLAEGTVAEISPASKGSLTDLGTGNRHDLVPGQTYRARPSAEGGIRFGTWELGVRARYAPASAEGLASLNGTRYRGTLYIERTEGGILRVVNELGVEEYLYSVLGKEMSPEWPMDALKAQAVISRAYALKNLGRFDEEGYDLLQDARSQVYGGVDMENPRAIQAVQETAGEVLTYKEQLVSTHFHSCCGGHTSAIDTAWPGRRTKPLAGVRDGFCAHTPHSRWSRLIPTEAVLDALPQDGKPYTKIRKVAVGRRDASGYVRILKFSTDSRTVRILASDLRKRIGPNILRSTYLTKVAVKDNGVQFAGKGWGHGVGLCQWGARVQADMGRKYRNILKFYYPGSKVTTWQD